MRALLLFSLILLSSCSMIPYEAPEAHSRIIRDLKVLDSDVLGVTEINWCVFDYGKISQCKPTRGLGVLAKNGLILSVYEDNIYSRVFTLSAMGVGCTHIQTGDNVPGLFYAFTDTKSFMLVPITPSGKANVLMREKIYEYLNSEGAKKFVGDEVKFVRETGDKEYQTSLLVVGTVPVPYVNRKPVHEMINPCPVR